MSKVTDIIVSDLETGEVLVEKRLVGARSRSGWFMFYQNKGMELIAKAPTPAVLKVFLYVAMGQTYEGGMKTTKADVREKLGLSKPTVISAFNWLKDNYIIHEWRVDGCSEFMVNPQYVNVGKFDDRMKEWNRRWESYMPMYQHSRMATKKQELKRKDKSSAS